MRFLAENWLWSLAALPLLIWILRRGDRVAAGRLRSLLGDRADEFVEMPNLHLRQWRRFLLVAALAWMAIALARPQWGAHDVTVQERGADIVIALDISNSMLAEDIPPNRIERAKAELGAFLDDFPRGRVGLVLFAGSAFVQCPLTLDYGTAQLFLRMADPGMLSEQGTALAAALSTSRELLAGGGGSGENYQAIILVTDGEDLEGEWQREAERCRDDGILILPVGVGQETGGLIPQMDSQGRSSGFMKDIDGNVVLSRLDIAALEQIGSMTGGSTFRIGGAGGLAGRQLRRLVERLDERELEERRVSSYEERFVWPLVLAFICLFVRQSLRPRRRPAGTGSGISGRDVTTAGAKLTVLILALAIFSATTATAGIWRPSGAGDADEGRRLFDAENYDEALHAFQNARAMNPDDARLSLAVGETLFQMGRIEEAVSEFQRALGQTDDPKLLAEALYNSGSAALAAGDPAAAAELLRQSLALDPDQLDVLRNLEVADQQLEQQQKQQQQQQPQDGEDQPQEEQQEQEQEQGQQQPEEQQEEEQQEEEQSGEEQQDEEQPPEEQSEEQQEDQVQKQDQESEQQPQEQELSEEELSREQALSLLRALDRDEEELKRSVEKRLKGKGTKSGKRW